MAAAAAAQAEDLTIRAGQKGHAAHGKVEIKFISVIEDSRCPVGTVCVWAGNARVKVEVVYRHRSRKTIELNTTVEPHDVEIEGYRIRLVDVSPKPGENKRGGKARPTIRLSISRR